MPLFLILLMAVVSLNAGIAAHFCNGELAEFKLVLGHGQASCGMEAAAGKANSQPIISSIPCCQDDFQEISVDDYQNHFPPVESVPTPSLWDDQLVFATLSTTSHDWNTAGYHSPPDLNAVSLPFVQVFLL